MCGLLACRHEDQALHLPADEVSNESAFPLGVLSGVSENDSSTVRRGDLLDSEREVAVVGVSEVGDGDAHETARLTCSHPSGVLISAVPERAHGFQHTVLKLGSNVRPTGDGA